MSLANRCGVAPTGANFVGSQDPSPTTRTTRFSIDERLNTVLLDLSSGFGRQYWWPAAAPFEVMIGAVLTQNTAWGNVELALNALRQRDALTASALLSLPESEEDGLEAWIRPSGSFRVKAKKLRALATWFQSQGETPSAAFQQLATRSLEPLRTELLGIYGIGPETADAILCYGVGRLSPVVDTYTRRILSRHGLGPLLLPTGAATFPSGDAMKAPYEELRTWLLQVLIPNQLIYEEFHALFVAAGKDNCKVKATCDTCPARTPLSF